MNLPLLSGRRAATAALLLFALLTAHGAAAQALRPDATLYLRPQVGISSYVGDNNKSAFKFEGAFPYHLGLEFGYQYTVPFSIGVAFHAGDYPSIMPDGDSSTRSALELLFRYTFAGDAAPLAPYLHGGLHASFGNVIDEAANEEGTRTAFGPVVGVGLDFLLSDQLSFFLEGNLRPAFPDDAADGNEENGSGSFDLLNSLGLGLKYNFKSAAVPLDVLSVNGPSRLEAGAPGTFTASVNSNATQPMELRWDWGDGSYGNGLTATHTYAQPGAYTVRFMGSNRKGSDEGTLNVTVVPKPVAASISGLTASPQNPDEGKPVRFSANVQGDAPITYNWDFGDGNTSVQATPSHTYDEPGDYTVTLQINNPAGSDTQTLELNVNATTSAICRDVTEMNSVYFGTNSSVLTEEGRAALQENLDLLRECRDITVSIEGYAGPGERNPQQLSDDRAYAVREFYMENDVDRTRLRTVGRGRVTGTTSKKEGAERYRRVDTIPR